MANPSLDAGKRLNGSTVCVPNLTAAVQGNLCFKIVPYTPEGESARWVPVVSPTNLGLNYKKASTAVLQKLLSAQILSILDSMTETSVLHLCDASRASAEFFEHGAKQALQGFTARVGVSRVTADPVYSFLFGKLDAQYMHHLAAAWFLGESQLAWLNPAYTPRFVTNRVYARIALRRTLLSECDRRAVMIVNRLQSTPAPH